MRTGRQRLLDERLPQLRFDLPDAGALDPRGLFSFAPNAVWLELGFGGGEHLAAQAETNPAVGFLGAEMFENGIAKLVSEIAQRGLGNIRIFPGDGRLLAAKLADASVGRVFILFPDPWPKERHKKRRIVQAALLDELARAMAERAELRLATDDRDYAAAMIAAVETHRAFRSLDVQDARPGDWPQTRYEQKAVTAGRRAVFLRAERVPRHA